MAAKSARRHECALRADYQVLDFPEFFEEGTKGVRVREGESCAFEKMLINIVNISALGVSAAGWAAGPCWSYCFGILASHRRSHCAAARDSTAKPSSCRSAICS